MWLPFSFPCCYCCLVTQLCLTLVDSLDYSPLGSSVHGISQARILAWVVIPFSRGSSWPRDRTCITCIGSPLSPSLPLSHQGSSLIFSHSCLTEIVQKGRWNHQYCKIQLAAKVWALSFYFFLCILKFLIFYHHIFDWNFCLLFFFQRRCYTHVLVWWQITADNSIIK